MTLFNFFVRHQNSMQHQVPVMSKNSGSLQLALDTRDDRSFYLSEWEDFDHEEQM